MSETPLPKIVVLISGSGSNLQAIIDQVTQGNLKCEIACVISNRAEAFGLERAKQSGIKTQVINHKDFDSRESFDVFLQSQIDLYNPTLVVLAGFMRILTASFTEHYEGKMLNIHPSLLPKYQGLLTHKRAIAAGDDFAGVTIHFVTAQLDGGPNIIQAKVAIDKDETENSLAQKVLVKEHLIYPMAIQWFIENRLKMNQNQTVLDEKVLNEQGFELD
ncbi:MAG: phosphoribosylglycinamide formyltransferase [Saccharospirillaceae bacterium]|nr:phosphoribosylglycinamide formyltransferase [Pseudomonadales bacterium]NRB78218.1 phosphoribosylglycinamide formyltransferase [Saccharospirillaceae bacterium]